MFGKLAGAWLGNKVAGSNSGTKGALIGYGVAALARRSVPALALVSVLGWGAKKLYARRNRTAPAYPSDAAPSGSALSGGVW